MEVNGQLHAPVALPQGKEPRYPFDRKLGGPQVRIFSVKVVTLQNARRPYNMGDVSNRTRMRRDFHTETRALLNVLTHVLLGLRVSQIREPPTGSIPGQCLAPTLKLLTSTQAKYYEVCDVMMP